MTDSPFFLRWRSWIPLMAGLILLNGTACNLQSADIQNGKLPVAVLDDVYEYNFDVDGHWNDFFNLDHAFDFDQGDLPIGLEVTPSGRVIGIARQLGSFDFKVNLYGYDSYTDAYGDYLDGAWFTLFVTEANSNEDCPLPGDQTTRELSICLGTVTKNSMDEGESLSLDVNYFVDFQKSYAVNALSFTVRYDSDSFQLEEDRLNSQILREAATNARADVSFDTTVPGELGVTLEVTQLDFGWPGRLMNLPFVAKKDLTQAEYEFEVEVQAPTVVPASATLPGTLGFNGTLEVENPATP